MRKWALASALIFACAALSPHVLAASQTEAEIATALGMGNAAEAERLADAALSGGGLTSSERGMLLADRGTAREAQGRHDEALVDLTQAIEMRVLAAADQARALYTRGAILDGQGRTGDAIGDYSAALALEPHFAPALNNRANAWRRENRMADAKRDYLASLAAGNPEAEYSFYGLGQIAEAEGNIQSARGFYAQAVAANPNYALAAERLAALGGGTAEGAAANTGVIHLRPPPSMQAAGHAGDADAPVVLRPPGQAVQPRPSRVVPASFGSAGPGLRPALDAAGNSGARDGSSDGQVQLGAWRSEEEAGQGWNSALKRSAGLLDGLSPHIVVADLPGRGRYYRLRVGPVADGAARLCAALKAQGVDCMPARD